MVYISSRPYAFSVIHKMKIVDVTACLFWDAGTNFCARDQRYTHGVVVRCPSCELSMYSLNSTLLGNEFLYMVSGVTVGRDRDARELMSSSSSAANIFVLAIL